MHKEPPVIRVYLLGWLGGAVGGISVLIPGVPGLVGWLVSLALCVASVHYVQQILDSHRNSQKLTFNMGKMEKIKNEIDA